MLAKKIVDTPFIFYLIGILASLRAVQHALMNYDRTLSKEHERLIDEWKKNTAPETSPELDFIKTSRNRILKGADLAARAIYSESAIGEGSNREITGTNYELIYYDDADKRQDLEVAIRRAIEWCDRELTNCARSKAPSALRSRSGSRRIMLMLPPHTAKCRRAVFQTQGTRGLPLRISNPERSTCFFARRALVPYY